jgi:hypothetical protein
MPLPLAVACCDQGDRNYRRCAVSAPEIARTARKAKTHSERKKSSVPGLRPDRVHEHSQSVSAEERIFVWGNVSGTEVET